MFEHLTGNDKRACFVECSARNEGDSLVGLAGRTACVIKYLFVLYYIELYFIIFYLLCYIMSYCIVFTILFCIILF